MSRLFLLLLLTTVNTAIVTDNPTLSNKLDQWYKKLERLTIAPPANFDDKISAKIDELNSLVPDEDLTDEDEEFLSVVRMWGVHDPEALALLARELQEAKLFDKDDNYEDETGDDDQELSEGDYAMDANDDWDGDEELQTSTTRTFSVSPSAITRNQLIQFKEPHQTAIAFTNERPKILDDSSLSSEEKKAIKQEAVMRTRNIAKISQCLYPQPRWLSIRDMAPSASTVYTPPCVQLHRCTNDCSCCHDEEYTCTPVKGQHVIVPLYTINAEAKVIPVRMLFYNHTECECLHRETLQRRHVIRATVARQMPVTERVEVLEQDEGTSSSPPTMRRCTCPVHFIARITESTCKCVCDWPDISRRRVCLTLSRGREHFGLRDRVCIDEGGCSRPSCEYGPYDRTAGMCPIRKVRRVRHGKVINSGTRFY